MRESNQMSKLYFSSLIDVATQNIDLKNKYLICHLIATRLYWPRANEVFMGNLISLFLI